MMTGWKSKQPVPWGSAIGLLAACLATLIGVGSGLEPDVILLRAAVAGVVLGCAAAVGSHLWAAGLRGERSRRASSAESVRGEPPAASLRPQEAERAPRGNRRDAGRL